MNPADLEICWVQWGRRQAVEVTGLRLLGRIRASVQFCTARIESEA